MQRTGRKNDPAFRVVVAEHTVGPKSGKIVEKVGSHYPRTKETILNSDRIKHWLSVGAKASDRIHNMLIAEGIIEGKKINVLPKKTPVVKEEALAEEAPEAPEAPEATEASEEGGEETADTPAEENTGAPADLPAEAPARVQRAGGSAQAGDSAKSGEVKEEAPAEEAKTEETPVDKAPNEAEGEEKKEK